MPVYYIITIYHTCSDHHSTQNYWKEIWHVSTLVSKFSPTRPQFADFVLILCLLPDLIPSASILSEITDYACLLQKNANVKT